MTDPYSTGGFSGPYRKPSHSRHPLRFVSFEEGSLFNVDHITRVYEGMYNGNPYWNSTGSGVTFWFSDGSQISIAGLKMKDVARKLASVG